MRSLLFTCLLALGALTAAFVTGCTPSIGDKCSQSTDCSLQGDRLCDTAQPGGYCTIFGCGSNSCPDYAACVLFHASVQGCTYDDRTISRTGRTFCMAGCKVDGDCRAGYVCVDPRKPPFNAVIIDDNQGQTVCVVAPTVETGVGTNVSAESPVCKSEGPPVPPIQVKDGGAAVDAGAGDAGAGDSGAGDAGLADGGDAGTPPSDSGGSSDGSVVDATLD